MTPAISSKNAPINLPAISAPILSMPIEIFGVVFSYSDDLSRHRAELVCRAMKDRVITTVAETELSSIRNFIEHLKQSLIHEGNESEQSALSQIEVSQQFTTLGKFKDSVYLTQEKLIEIINRLTPETQLKLLARISPPAYMKDIFFLASEERAIKQADNVLDQRLKNTRLSYAALKLFSHGYYIRAVEVAESIPNSQERNQVWKTILSKLEWSDQEKKIPLTTQLITAAQKISDETFKQETLKKSCSAFVKRGLFNSAVKTAQFISSENERLHSLRDISLAMAKSKHFDDAIKTAQSVSLNDPNRNEHALNDLLEILIPNHEYERAIKVFNLIQRTEIREDAVSSIEAMIRRIDNPDEQIRLAEMISDPTSRGWLLWRISKDLSKESRFDKATQVALLIQDERTKLSALNIIKKKMDRNPASPILVPLECHPRKPN